MNTKTDDTCKKLERLIRQSLTPLIPSDYLLLDLPYYSNIGDNLNNWQEWLKVPYINYEEGDTE